MHDAAGTAKIPGDAAAAIKYVLQVGGNVNTQKSRSSGERRWALFLISQGVNVTTSKSKFALALIGCSLTQAASIVASYLASLAKEGMKYSSITNYGWAARALIARHGGPDLAGNVFLKGFMMCLRRLTGDDVKRKKAVSQKFLLKIREGLDLEKEADANTWCAILVAFMTLLRSAEYSLKAGQRAGLDREAPLLAEELRLLREPSGRVRAMQVHINRSKTDQIGRGATTELARIGGPLCAVEAVMDMELKWPKRGEEPAFCHFTYKKRAGPVRYSTITNLLKRTAARLGLSPKDFASHSLRAGGASALARGGAPPWQIQAIGRWKSDAYLLYIRNSSFGKWTTDAARMLTSEATDEYVFDAETVFDAQPDPDTEAGMKGILDQAKMVPDSE